MTEFKKGDKVILHAPGSLDPAHNPLMGKEVRIVTEVQITGELEWYSIELSSGVLIPVPTKWLRKKPDKSDNAD